MANEDRHIAEVIWSIAHKGEQAGLRFPVMSGKVVAGSVDEGECTCTVRLSVDDDSDAGRDEILLNGVSGNVNGVLCYPADDSDVWVAEIDGSGKWGIVKTSTLAKMVTTVGGSKLTIVDGTITLNDGSLDGLVKVIELTSKLNNVENKLNDLIGKWNAFCTGYVPGSPSTTGLPATLTTQTETTLTLTMQGDIENPHVKQ
jgi:hypothetical protein